MDKFPEYRIKSVGDFLSIPREKLAHALQDFCNWLFLHTCDEVKSIIKDNPGIELVSSEFIWLDDGKHGIIPVSRPKKPAAKGEGDD